MRITELDFRKLKIQSGFRNKKNKKKLTLLYGGLKFSGTYDISFADVHECRFHAWQ